MGEVYEALDRELDERVALKTIRSETASLTSVIERFKQEVRQARGISHSNVCRVYEVFSHEQPSGERVWFLTMELLEGQTLTERIQQNGPFNAGAAVGLVEQMVAGLAAAHELGIVHRDFKSSNVMLVDSPAGKTRVVITDFGLALKVLADQHIAPEESKQGTARYMAPEQAQGRDIGFAADQYALGVVMCEMLTGQCPARPEFIAGNKVTLPPGHTLSPRWERVIRRCLEFRPEDRFPHIADVAEALSPKKRPRGIWIMTGAAAVMLALMAGFLFSPWRRANIRLDEVTQLTSSTDISGQPSISRDGTVVAYSSERAEPGNGDIWLQHLPSGNPIRITTNAAQDVDPSISPDGTAVVFRSQRDGGGIYIFDRAASGERLLVPDGRDPHFSPDGQSIVYWVGHADRTVPSGKVILLSLKSGSSVRLAPEFEDARYPTWSPDGRHVVFTGCRTGDQPMPACLEWWVANTDGSQIRNTGALSLLRKQQLEPVEGIGGWQGNAAIFSARVGNTMSLWQLKIRENTWLASGSAQPLTSEYVRNADEVSVADNGKIAFSQLSGAMHVWVVANASTSKGIVTKVTQDAEYDTSPYVSHNGRWLVFARGIGTHHEIWIRNLQTGQESRFRSSVADQASPILDDSGETVAFEDRDSGGRSSVQVGSRGKPARVLCTGCSNPMGWFGKHLAFFYRDGLPSKIKLAEPESGTTRTVLETKDLSISEAAWAPENEFLLFSATSPAGLKRVFAVLFPEGTGAVTGNWIPITDEAIIAEKPRWSGDGKTIFYISTRDGSPCIWGQHFDQQARKITGTAFPVLHLHNPRWSPEMIAPHQFQISVADDSIYLNLGEASATVWTGRLKQPGLFSRLSSVR